MSISTITEGMKWLFETYDHEYTDHGINTVIDNWKGIKTPLISILRNHPNWDEDQMAIVFSKDYERAIDQEQFEKFKWWCEIHYAKTETENIKRNEVLYCGHDYNYWYEMWLENARGSDEEYEAERARHSFRNFPHLSGDYFVNWTYYMEYITKYNQISNFMNVLRFYFNVAVILKNVGKSKAEIHIAPKELADALNAILPEVKAKSGQKISRIVRKFGQVTGLDQIKEMRSGRDYGWNRQFAMFADAINPLVVTRHTIISVNPLDYLTSSFGHKWSSCHTIDYHNYRDADNSYEGMYMSGNLSYMGDPSTMVFYTVDGDFNGKEYWKEDKIKRNLFHFEPGNNVLIQSRVYPDGRDGGEQGISAQFRAVMQQVLATCLGVNNLWKKGSHSDIRRYTTSQGTHYKDYLHYSDCTISFLQDGNESEEVHIGSRPISIYTGRYHEVTDSLTGKLAKCEHCGDIIEDPDEAIYSSYDGVYFCCEECAREAEYVYADDVEDWRPENHCTYNNFVDLWFYYDSEMITTDDGLCGFEDDLVENGYRPIDGEWTKDWHECPECGCVVGTDEWDEEKEKCIDCAEREMEESKEQKEGDVA